MVRKTKKSSAGTKGSKTSKKIAKKPKARRIKIKWW